jgi:hypothetical protein
MKGLSLNLWTYTHSSIGNCLSFMIKVVATSGINTRIDTSNSTCQGGGGGKAQRVEHPAASNRTLCNTPEENGEIVKV